MEAIIWTKTPCPWCDKAKEELTRRGIAYEVRDITKDWAKQDLLNELPEVKTLPQIIIDGIYVGGYNSLMELKN